MSISMKLAFPRSNICSTYVFASTFWKLNAYPREHPQLKELREATLINKYTDW